MSTTPEASASVSENTAAFLRPFALPTWRSVLVYSMLFIGIAAPIVFFFFTQITGFTIVLSILWILLLLFAVLLQVPGLSFIDIQLALTLVWGNAFIIDPNDTTGKAFEFGLGDGLAIALSLVTLLMVATGLMSAPAAPVNKNVAYVAQAVGGMRRALRLR